MSFGAMIKLYFRCFCIFNAFAFTSVLNVGDAAKAPVIYIARDSTTADNSHHPKSPQRGWGQLFSELVIKSATLENRARAGRSIPNTARDVLPPSSPQRYTGSISLFSYTVKPLPGMNDPYS